MLCDELAASLDSREP